MSKIAVVLFNLGGPDSLKAVRPFLFNLFNDRAIIDLPQPLRAMLAGLIALRRGAKARHIYGQIGGKSPILEHTAAQAEALEKRLKSTGRSGDEYQVFVSMRYWHPMSDVVARKVKAYAPDHILLLPLYPQYSTTTTASSFAGWDASCRKNGLDVPTTRVCCYPTQLSFIAAHARLLKDIYWQASEQGKPRVLFSAHGLPERVIQKGDPYQWQVEKTVAAIRQILAIDDLDSAICYQSRVGNLKWIEPSTEDEIARAGKDNVPVLVVPVSFISEHSETLVELDIDYRTLAMEKGVPSYHRVPALGVEPLFIEALGELCLAADRGKVLCCGGGTRACPEPFAECPTPPVIEESREERKAA